MLILVLICMITFHFTDFIIIGTVQLIFTSFIKLGATLRVVRLFYLLASIFCASITLQSTSFIVICTILVCFDNLQMRYKFKDTRTEKAPSNKTPTLSKSMNMDIWIVGTSNHDPWSNQLLWGSATEIKFSKKIKSLLAKLRSFS